MAKLSYFGTKISPRQMVSKQGYLVALDVPICRTGFQEYLGSELEGHPGYDPAWGLNPNERYQVLRPLEEVTSPATVASFEGNSVVDEHPDPTRYPGSLVTCENDAELSRGHGQNVRVGGEGSLESGETPLLADLHIKDIGLIRKTDEGIRDVSCGYTFTLVRRNDGQLVQTNIRGNHIAIVPTGRAGKEVAIGDTAPPKSPKEKKPVKRIKDRLIGLGLIAAATATDADPEEIARMAKEATKDDEPEEDKDKKAKEEKAAADKAAKDAAETEEKAKKEAEEKAAKDKAAKDADVEDLDEPKDDDKAEVLTDADDEADEVDDLGKATLAGKGVLDSARDLVKVLKPIMGSGSLPKAAVDAYNTHVKALNAMAKNPYAQFVQVQKPVLAVDASAAQNEINPREFFAGRTYAEGQKAYRAHLESKGAK